MARPPSKQPTDGELEILKILWETGPAGLGQIHAVLQERRGVAITTVATMLKMMLAKEMVRARGRSARLLVDGRRQPQGRRLGPSRQARPACLRRLGSPAGRPSDRGGRARRPRARRDPGDLEIPAGQRQETLPQEEGDQLMSSTLLTTSPVWTAAGWTMLHLVWVGAAIGLMAALVRRLLKSARPETRYGVALTCLLVLSVSPALIFVRVFEPDSGDASRRSARSRRCTGEHLAVVHRLGSAAIRRGRRFAALASDRPVDDPARSRLDSVVTYLPWFWLCGSLSTLVMLATGLVGVEQLRRSSRLVESGDLPRRCRALADSLGIARRVSVGICDRLAMPVLIGIVRPLILLPPAALSGWSVEQLEMVLLHELAHLRRWDNLVNLIQRFVESLLFFHPVVWWLSGWVRLERELCCDRLVVDRVGQPVAYAEMLVALSGTRQPKASGRCWPWPIAR